MLKHVKYIKSHGSGLIIDFKHQDDIHRERTCQKPAGRVFLQVQPTFPNPEL